MKPDLPIVMRGFFGTMLTEIAPRLNAEYSTGSISIMSMMLYLTAQEYERAAEVRVTDNAEMRALFADAARLVQDKSLKARLEEAAGTKDRSLVVSALDENHAALSALLIELQAHVEESTAPWAAGLEARIWDHLLASTERRRLHLPVTG